MITVVKEKIIQIAKKIVFGSASTPELYVNWLKKQGIEIGQGTIFYDPINTVVDTQNPKLIKLGNNVRITSGCKILTHDFSSSVIGGFYGECVGAIGVVEIEDNVFIGMNTIILRNTHIGKNTIIGAGSVVSGKIENNSVYAGVPAKKIMTLDEFYKKRTANIEREIRQIIDKIDIKNETEIWKYLREYACYFKDAPSELKNRQMNDTGYFDVCEKFYSIHKPKYLLDYFIVDE